MRTDTIFWTTIVLLCKCVPWRKRTNQELFKSMNSSMILNVVDLKLVWLWLKLFCFHLQTRKLHTFKREIVFHAPESKYYLSWDFELKTFIEKQNTEREYKKQNTFTLVYQNNIQLFWTAIFSKLWMDKNYALHWHNQSKVIILSIQK